MLSAIKLVVSENGKLLDTVTKETDTQPDQLIKSLEEFQRTANETLTKLIEQHGGEDLGEVDDADKNDDDPDDELVSPRKKKK